MKRRLLSLLLVMAMLLSMVPFQAFAEEVDEAPALLEETEEIVSEIPEDTVPEITVETVPETTEETVPETTEETVPETTEETVPVVLEEDPALPEEEEVPLLLEEPEQAEAPVEAEVPAEGERVITVETRIGIKRDLSMIEGLAGYTFEVDEAFKDVATIEHGSVLAIKEGFALSDDLHYYVIRVTATKEDSHPVTIEVVIYAEKADIQLCVNGAEEAATAYTLNYYANKSFTLAVKASDGGPLGNVTWTQPSTKLLKRSIDKDTGALTYTSTGKTGTATISVASDWTGSATTLTVNVVKQVVDINIKVPASARIVTETEGNFMMKGVIMTAGQKLSLSTDIPKDAPDKAVTWEIINPQDVKPKPVSDDMDPEGAVVTEPYWESVVSIDEKGVLRTNAGVTMKTVAVGVRVRLTSTAEDENPVEDYLLVLIQPPVETMVVQPFPLRSIGSFSLESMEGGSNINITDNMSAGFDISNGPMLLIPVAMSQASGNGLSPNFDILPDISWKFSGSKKVVEFMTLDEYFGDSIFTQSPFFEMLRAMDARVMIPKAPGKVSFTATTRDGSGAKCSYSFHLVGHSFAYASISAPKDFDSSKPLHPGDQVQFTSEAYYYEGAPATGVQREWYVYCEDDSNADDFATIDQKGKLTITDRVSKSVKLFVGCELSNKEGAYAWDEYPVYVEPVNDYTLGLHSQSDGLLNTVNSYTYEPGEVMTLLPFWVDKSGRVDKPLAAKDVSYKVSGSACAFDKATGKLTFKKPGTTKITVTATLDGKKQSATYTFHCEYFTRKTEIQNKPADGVITVVGGKSLSLKAINWSSDTTKATDQSIFWSLNGPADINWKTGKLTTQKVTAAVDIKVNALCQGIYAADKQPSDSITIRIIPEKTQYRSYADANLYNGYFYLTGDDETLVLEEDFGYWVTSYGCDAESRVTDVISNNTKIAKVVKEDGVVTGIRIPADAKPGKVTFTVKGQVRAGTEVVGDKEVEIWKDAPSAKLTINAVKPVTSIEIKWPTDKDGNELPLYVGKSLKLSATVNSDATNKKLVWHVDSDENLEGFDKTTIKNGVLKVDKSTLTMSRTYFVWATSEDGNSKSDVLKIQAYAMTGAINIASIGDWPDGNYADYLNNRTVTIKQGEKLEFGALVSDVNGDYKGANPDVTWTVSGNKGGIIAFEEMDYGVDVLGVTGKNPGTVTVKATAKDGSRKTATFTLVVEPHTLSAPELETDKLYRSCVTTAPSIAYDYTKGNENINCLKSTDVKFSSNYDKVTTAYNEAEGVWKISVSDDAKVGKVVTITVEDVRTDIEEIDRAQPLSLKYTIEDPQP